MAVAQTPYKGHQGEAYLSQRSSSLSDHNQNLRASLFKDLGAADRTILDFGCGTGGVVSRIEAKQRVGIEIGEAAADLARQKGVEVFSDLSQVGDRSVDVAISFHAIEHVERPIDVLLEVGRVVKADGFIRLIVPGELPTDPKQSAWRENEDRHLHTWTPLLLGNLAAHCGFKEIRTHIAPMPTGSRLVKVLRPLPPVSRAAHWYLSKRRNSLNVILDARPASYAARH